VSSIDESVLLLLLLLMMMMMMMIMMTTMFFSNMGKNTVNEKTKLAVVSLTDVEIS
jgi:hypothetical protein